VKPRIRLYSNGSMQLVNGIDFLDVGMEEEWVRLQTIIHGRNLINTIDEIVFGSQGILNRFPESIDENGNSILTWASPFQKDRCNETEN